MIDSVSSQHHCEMLVCAVDVGAHRMLEMDHPSGSPCSTCSSSDVTCSPMPVSGWDKSGDDPIFWQGSPHWRYFGDFWFIYGLLHGWVLRLRSWNLVFTRKILEFHTYITNKKTHTFVGIKK